jgi:hypothetical protein
MAALWLATTSERGEEVRTYLERGDFTLIYDITKRGPNLNNFRLMLRDDSDAFPSDH